MLINKETRLLKGLILQGCDQESDVVTRDASPGAGALASLTPVEQLIVSIFEASLQVQ